MNKRATPELLAELVSLLADRNQDELDVLALLTQCASDTRHYPDGVKPTAGELLVAIPRLRTSDRRDLLVTARRLKMGREVYGPLSIMHDPRDWAAEAYEEDIDGGIYRACAAIRKERRSK